MVNAISFQISIETTVRCGGSCAGCALTEVERKTKQPFNEVIFKKQLETAKEWIRKKSIEKSKRIEAISIFFGQGDHFLMEENELLKMSGMVGELWPQEWKDKTVFFLTASAVTPTLMLRKRAAIIRSKSLEYKCNWFVQVVFDPKKFTNTKKFKTIYMDNILFLKDIFSMVELTVNLAGDIADSMSPLKFHSWVKEHRFKHIEFNLVAREELKKMWINDLKKVWDWLYNVTELSFKDKEYEINFMPWTIQRLRTYNETEEISTIDILNESSVYINGNASAIPSQVGPIANVSPWIDRLETPNISEKKMELRVIQHFSTKPPCRECKYRKLCSSSGVYSWTNVMPMVYSNGCPWGLDSWYKHIDGILKKEGQFVGKTIFDKNPVPDILLVTNNGQKTKTYFESKNIS